MKALLDTNIIIHRENNKISNYSIGHLFNWLDKLNYIKVIHPYTINEIRKFKDNKMLEVLEVKLKSYEVLKTIKEPNEEFLDKLSIFKNKSKNDIIDNILLYEVFLNRIDILITEDRELIKKADHLNLSKRVLSINQFISIASNNHPDLIDYKMLSVRQEYFGNIDIKSEFFDSFKRDYKEFELWFNKKNNEKAYICKDGNLILGFLYMKIENQDENYRDIEPIFNRTKRLKVGTFKVESTGFRLGERFIKIIFDNAILNNVSEIYLTVFTERPEYIALIDLLFRWGFFEYGIKNTENGIEKVLVKKMKIYDNQLTIKQNFPNILFNKKKFFLPIQDIYHTTLLPDSKLNNENEIDFIDKFPHRYALQKVYISWAPLKDVKPGDFLVLYRYERDGFNKKYKSVITTIGIIDNYISYFPNKEEFFQCCQNRSVFTKQELNSFWENHKNNIKVIKFIYLISLKKRLTLGYLWDNKIIKFPQGPRTFDEIYDNDFKKILKDSETKIAFL